MVTMMLLPVTTWNDFRCPDALIDALAAVRDLTSVGVSAEALDNDSTMVRSALGVMVELAREVFTGEIRDMLVATTTVFESALLLA